MMPLMMPGRVRPVTPYKLAHPSLFHDVGGPMSHSVLHSSLSCRALKNWIHQALLLVALQVGSARSSGLKLRRCSQISSHHRSVPGVGTGGMPTPLTTIFQQSLLGRRMSGGTG
jgi:hypothetical protein